jgi:hypothetical protein
VGTSWPLLAAVRSTSTPPGAKFHLTPKTKPPNQPKEDKSKVLRLFSAPKSWVQSNFKERGGRKYFTREALAYISKGERCFFSL